MKPTHLHFDPYSGISGDMFLGALVDLGVSLEEIERGLAKLPIGPFSLHAERVKRAGIMGIHVHVEVDEINESTPHHHNHHDHHDHEPDHHHTHPHTHEHHHHESDKIVTHTHEHGPGHHEHSHKHEHEHSHGHHHHEHGHGHEHRHDHQHDHSHPHRTLSDIYAIVEAADLSPRALARAKEAYRRLAEAEAQVHGATPETIHFHEVGAKDAIVDIAAAMLGVELLGAETFSSAPLTVGHGMVRCQHGEMPIPAPATALLLQGMPTVSGKLSGEMVTPTGAAILATLLHGEGGLGFGQSELVAEKVGYGAGSRVYENFANFLRLFVCQPVAEPTALPVTRETILSLECEIDDMTPELAGYLLERLLAAGALDAHFRPVQMKKNRPGFSLRVLAPTAMEAALTEIIFRETSTFGLRRHAVERYALNRRSETIDTELGPIPIKLGLWGEETLKAAPEYEACAALARAKSIPLARVFETARAAIAQRFGGKSA